MLPSSSPVILALDDAYRGIGIIGVRQLYDHEYDFADPAHETAQSFKFKYLNEVKTQYGSTRNSIINPAKILKTLVDLEYIHKNMGSLGICVTDAPPAHRRGLPPKITTLFERIHLHGVTYAPNDAKFLNNSPLYNADPFKHSFAIGFSYCEAFQELARNTTDIISPRHCEKSARKWWHKLIP
jgi:hypothetical protein